MIELSQSEKEYAEKAAEFLFNIAVTKKTEYIWQLKELGGQYWLENRLFELFNKTVGIPLLPFLVRGLFELGPYRMERKNVLINLNKKYGNTDTINFPRYAYTFIIDLVHKTKSKYKHRPMLADMTTLLRYVFADNLTDFDDLSVTDGVYSKDELKNLNNYLTLRNMKADTQKHFGDILSAL